MRMLLSALVVLASVVVLSSCGLLGGGLPAIFEDDDEKADARMEQVADALNRRDSAALKALFSPHALERATDIDAGLEYLLSFFPNGGVTWERDTVNSQGGFSTPKVLLVYYTLAAEGKEYTLFFADFTEDDDNPDRLGIYAIGVTPLLNNPDSGPESIFFAWTGSIEVDESGYLGYPGVYVPDYDRPEVSDYAMKNVADHLGYGDRLFLAERFSVYVRTTLGTQLTTEIDELFTSFPKGEVAWKPLEDGPVVHRGPDGAGETVLLLSRYPVSSGGEDFWVTFAYFPVNESNPSLEGIYALGVAPRSSSGDSPQEQALFAWADSFDVSASTPPGIFISE